MYDLNVGGYRPVQASTPAGISAGTEAKKASAAGTAQAPDAVRVTGRAQPGQPVSAEQALGRLHEMGLLESASRPLSLDTEPPADTAATLTVALDGASAAPEEAASAAAEAQAEAEPVPETDAAAQTGAAEAGTEGAETGTEMEPPAPDTAEEWRPYQPPAEMAARIPQFASGDGQSVTMALYPSSDGLDALLLLLGDFSLPLDPGGALLAGFLDGSFRLLTFNQAALTDLLENGQAVAEPPANSVPEGRADAPAASVPLTGPAAGSGPSSPAAPTRTEAPPSPSATAENAPAEPRAAERPALVPEVQVRVPDMARKPGGAEEWATARAAERSFRQVAERWLRDTPDPLQPEARAQLHSLRQDWAEQLRSEDPAAFRAWLQTGGEAQPKAATDAHAPEAAPLPRDFGEPERQRWMERGVLSYSENTRPAERSGVRFLAETVARLIPQEDTETISLLKSAYHAASGEWRRTDETGALTRRLADYIAQLMAGTLRGNTKAQADSLTLPDAPQRDAAELERAWKRRQIAFEVDSAWTANLKDWLTEADGWRISRCRDYVNGKTNEWTTGLMRDAPANFRQWLGCPARYAASAGWFNSATGSFPIETLPEGFTDEDLRRWMQWDVLDFL